MLTNDATIAYLDARIHTLEDQLAKLKRRIDRHDDRLRELCDVTVVVSAGRTHIEKNARSKAGPR